MFDTNSLGCGPYCSEAENTLARTRRYAEAASQVLMANRTFRISTAEGEFGACHVFSTPHIVSGHKPCKKEINKWRTRVLKKSPVNLGPSKKTGFMLCFN